MTHLGTVKIAGYIKMRRTATLARRHHAVVIRRISHSSMCPRGHCHGRSCARWEARGERMPLSSLAPTRRQDAGKRATLLKLQSQISWAYMRPAQGQTADGKVKAHNRNALSYNRVGDYLQNARRFISQSDPKSCCGQGIGFKSVIMKRLERTKHPHTLAHYSHSHCSECACVYSFLTGI